MHRLLSSLLALGLGLNGAWMLAVPASWYAAIPGARETGPFNPHFIRDIGSAFLVAAVAFAALAVARSRAWPAALSGAGFLGLHALVHLWDLAAGREDAHQLLSDLPAILVPGALGLWLAWPAPTTGSYPIRARRSASRGGLIARLAEPKLRAFERDFGYDTSYLRDVARISGGGFLRFFLFTIFADHREDTPADVLFTAKIVAAMREDCGPCTQLVVRMAARAGVAPQTLRAILAGDKSKLNGGAALAFAFANAVLDRNILAANDLRKEVVAHWGDKALVTLAFALASSRVYPTVKYALGHGHACVRIVVGTDEVVATRRASA
jgi:hypothetical protein